MIRSAIVSQKETSTNFVTRLVRSNYNLRDVPHVELLFDTDVHFRSIKKNYSSVERLNLYIRLLVNELKKVGKDINQLKIKEDLVKNKVIVYRILGYDPVKQKLFDYYFILDSVSQKVCCYKRYTNYQVEQKRLLKSVEYLHNSFFLDFEEIYNILIRNGFNITVQEVQHLIEEI